MIKRLRYIFKTRRQYFFFLFLLILYRLQFGHRIGLVHILALFDCAARFQVFFFFFVLFLFLIYGTKEMYT